MYFPALDNGCRYNVCLFYSLDKYIIFLYHLKDAEIINSFGKLVLTTSPHFPSHRPITDGVLRISSNEITASSERDVGTLCHPHISFETLTARAAKQIQERDRK